MICKNLEASLSSVSRKATHIQWALSKYELSASPCWIIGKVIVGVFTDYEFITNWYNYRLCNTDQLSI